MINEEISFLLHDKFFPLKKVTPTTEGFKINFRKFILNMGFRNFQYVSFSVFKMISLTFFFLIKQENFKMEVCNCAGLLRCFFTIFFGGSFSFDEDLVCYLQLIFIHLFLSI